MWFALLLLWSAGAAARHGSSFLDPHRPTSAIRLELVEIPSPASTGAKQYRLRAEGVPRGFSYDVWAKNFGQPFTLALAGLRLNEAGELVAADNAGRMRRLADIALEPGAYPDGAVWMVALASDDHKLSAFAKVIPHPLAAHDGACAVSLELISLHGNRFLATGTGFAPGTEVEVEQRTAGRVTQRKLRITAEGRLPADVLAHGGVGGDTGAHYAVKSNACAPIVQYQWGEAALMRH